MQNFTEVSPQGIIEISFPTDRVSRIRTRVGFDRFTEKQSVAVVRSGPPLDLVTRTDGDCLSVGPESGGSEVRWCRTDGLFEFRFRGQPVTRTVGPVTASAQGTSVAFHFDRNIQHFYGLGEKAGKLEKSRQKWVLQNHESYSYDRWTRALYLSIPFFQVISPEGCFGIFLDQVQHSYFDFGSEKGSDQFSFGSESRHEMDFYLIFGDDPNQVVREYFGLTGTAYLPPRRALGLHQCRWSYKTDAQVRTLMDRFDEHKIPADLIYFDIDYMEQFRMFTLNQGSFPDIRRLLDEVEARGYHPVFIIDPGIKQEAGYPVYDDGVDEDVFLKDSRGLWQGTVWADGSTVFPDFFREEVRLWWERRHRRFFEGELGHSPDLWNDMNEPAHGLKKPPADVYFHYEGKKFAFREFHNAFALMEARATREYADRTGKRRFVLSRSGFAGIQRYAGVWTGDNWATYEHLGMTVSMMLNLSLSGVPVVGCDGLGYSGLCTPGAAIRWAQMMVLFPIFRFHSAEMFPAKEAWSFGTVVLKEIRKVLQLRYSFLPHLYSLMVSCHLHGTLVIKPLFFDHLSDAKTYQLDNHYLVGDSVLVAPVVRPFVLVKRVYLPGGTWVRLDDGKRFRGGRYHWVSAPFQRIPIFVRAGSVLFRQKPGHNHKPADRTLEVQVYLDGDRPFVADFFDDDGESLGSPVTHIRFSVAQGTLSATLVAPGKSQFDRLEVTLEGIIVAGWTFEALGLSGSEVVKLPV